MRRSGLITIGLVILGMVYLYHQDNEPSFVKPIVENKTDLNEVKGSSSAAPQDKFVAPEAPLTMGVPTEVGSEDATEIKIKKNFFEHLKAMSQCLQIKNQVNEEQMEPVLDHLIESLKPAFGDMAIYTDDWVQTDLKYSDGVARRIRMEVNYENQNQPAKYLYVYKIGDQGIPELENIDEQQSQNPTDDYISSLEAGANVTLKEKGGRAYFTGGEEVIVIEKNSKLESFTLTKNNKTFSCNSITSVESNCQCF